MGTSFGAVGDLCRLVRIHSPAAKGSLNFRTCRQSSTFQTEAEISGRPANHSSPRRRAGERARIHRPGARQNFEARHQQPDRVGTARARPGPESSPEKVDVNAAPAEGRDARLRISVVVPSWRDAGKNLAALLPALSRQERVAETIVVDAGGRSRQLSGSRPVVRRDLYRLRRAQSRRANEPGRRRRRWRRDHFSTFRYRSGGRAHLSRDRRCALSDPGNHWRRIFSQVRRAPSPPDVAGIGSAFSHEPRWHALRRPIDFCPARRVHESSAASRKFR